MQMLDKKQQVMKLKELTVEDGKVMVQLIDRLVSSGQLKGEEMSLIGKTRDRIVDSISKAAGLNGKGEK